MYRIYIRPSKAPVSHLFYYSCSDNGTVVVSTVGLGIEDKDTVIHFNQSMKAICVENDSAAKKDKSFIVGETETFPVVRSKQCHRRSTDADTK